MKSLEPVWLLFAAVLLQCSESLTSQGTDAGITSSLTSFRQRNAQVPPGPAPGPGGPGGPASGCPPCPCGGAPGGAPGPAGAVSPAPAPGPAPATTGAAGLTF